MAIVVPSVALIGLFAVFIAAGWFPELAPRTSDPDPWPTLPAVVESFVVVEAIDLPKKPSLNPEWHIDPRGSLWDDAFVTPCGVLVSFAEGEDGVNMVGYEVSTGARLWSHRLKDLTGQIKPRKDAAPPTYTNDCRMVAPIEDAEIMRTKRPFVAVVVDLASGEANSLYVEGLDGCWAAGNDWAGCTYQREDGEKQFVMAIGLDGSEPSWSVEAPVLTRGDFVVNGMVWTPQGYRDPATGNITFGSDAVSTPRSQETEQLSVQYLQVFRPGGYRSDLVVRLDGQMGYTEGLCTLRLWDPIADTEIWTGAEQITCGRRITHDWAVGGQALIVWSQSLQVGVNTSTYAFALADGGFLWDYPADLDAWGWEGIRAYPTGVSESIVKLTYYDRSEGFVRISDGVELTMPEEGKFSPSQTMVYYIGTSARGQSCELRAYIPDTLRPTAIPRQAWSIKIAPACTERMWTFATGGIMYVVVGDRIVPLVESAR